MNCANHPDRERAAFCQNCGKPLCTECTRTIGASIFCEPCFTARTTGVPGYTPVSGFDSRAPGYTPVAGAPSSQPNPGLAALLGFIPGVGAMYNEQYGKGIVHLIVFALLVSLAHENGIFGLFIMGWVIYQVIEAHHTARARLDGTPLPNPFGLNDLSERLGFGKAWPSPPPAAPFTPGPDPATTTPPAGYPGAAPFVDPYAAGAVPPTPPYGYPYAPPVSQWGAAQDYPYTAPIPPVPPMPPYADPNVPTIPYTRRFPAGAAWLIGLGVLFLFANTGIFSIRARYFGPFLLIGLGVFTFVRRMTSAGFGIENDGTPHYQWRLMRAVRSSVWLILSGILWLFDALDIITWSRSWPVFLIAGGILLILKHTLYSYPPAPYIPYPGYPTTSVPPTPGTAIVPTHATDNSDQEGR